MGYSEYGGDDDDDELLKLKTFQNWITRLNIRLKKYWITKYLLGYIIMINIYHRQIIQVLRRCFHFHRQYKPFNLTQRNHQLDQCDYFL